VVKIYKMFFTIFSSNGKNIKIVRLDFAIKVQTPTSFFTCVWVFNGHCISFIYQKIL